MGEAACRGRCGGRSASTANKKRTRSGRIDLNGYRTGSDIHPTWQSDWDDADNLISQLDASTNTWSWTHDAVGRVISGPDGEIRLAATWHGGTVVSSNDFGKSWEGPDSDFVEADFLDEQAPHDCSMVDFVVLNGESKAVANCRVSTGEISEEFRAALLRPTTEPDLDWWVYHPDWMDRDPPQPPTPVTSATQLNIPTSASSYSS